MNCTLLTKFKKPFLKYSLIGAAAWFIYEEVKVFVKHNQRIRLYVK